MEIFKIIAHSHPSRHLLFLEDEAEVESDTEKLISDDSSTDIEHIDVEN